MMIPIQESLEADCSVLLMRALMNKSIKTFGEDGDGKYGRSQYPLDFIVEDMAVDINSDLETGEVKLFLKDYASRKHGFIATDKNFVISMNNFLEENFIDPKCLSYSPINKQGYHFVSFLLNVPKLFG